ncbi:ACP S-malonyltransferase [Novosphingobium resinovorum]|jgi:[acyl-carrier-protein] S-malonyltransferase|uniref:Malonyl CoA-acyl carrier protein transacylase n=1 Tax=Novosphingobium resinovorum TaxID=158500 RepID=A0A031K3P8_9SPHN|nr:MULTISPECIES: ACP S-malonyltransferase [Novosphingobium]AOR78433.1 [acyl-carrier-protein] S-malonyltransferase [Novosphingobium resinovorum]EZP84601.1 Malonyl CoA-acyl carrier protein transacylase [Novosphingobium resinovorum]MBF7010970.1 ACP S-malonyltransferase [Novosphingobium sp. HR1a]WJM28964.1 ACP S-malonyltransferase [Novosphingobium resinovorum]
MRAFVFPGQGSQKVGMGAELAQASAVAREVFQEVDEALGQNLFRIMSEGPEDQLTLTENAQPAIMANAIAVLRVLEKEGGISLADKADFVAGHSLGEYTALCAAGAFSLADTARLLKLRGQSMQAAVPVGVGAMAALLGADIEKATALAEAAAEGQVCTVANDNDPTQVVISGHKEAIERAIALVKDHGIKRGIALPVSAPFHCPLMQPAADAMAEALAATPPGALRVALFANVTAAVVTDPAEVQRLLVEQVTGRVRWRESAIAMHAAGVERFVEIGGKVVGPMIKRSAGEVDVVAAISMAEIEELAKSL